MESAPAIPQDLLIEQCCQKGRHCGAVLWFEISILALFPPLHFIIAKRGLVNDCSLVGLICQHGQLEGEENSGVAFFMVSFLKHWSTLSCPHLHIFGLIMGCHTCPNSLSNVI